MKCEISDDEIRKWREEFAYKWQCKELLKLLRFVIIACLIVLVVVGIGAVFSVIFPEFIKTWSRAIINVAMPTLVIVGIFAICKLGRIDNLGFDKLRRKNLEFFRQEAEFIEKRRKWIEEEKK